MLTCTEVRARRAGDVRDRVAAATGRPVAAALEGDDAHQGGHHPDAAQVRLQSLHFTMTLLQRHSSLHLASCMLLFSPCGVLLVDPAPHLKMSLVSTGRSASCGTSSTACATRRRTCRATAWRSNPTSWTGTATTRTPTTTPCTTRWSTPVFSWRSSARRSPASMHPRRALVAKRHTANLRPRPATYLPSLLAVHQDQYEPS